MQKMRPWLIICIGLLYTSYSAAITLADIKRLKKEPTNQTTQSALDQSRATTQAIFKSTEATKPLPVSLIEQDYSLRAGQILQQFGYETFRNHAPSATLNGSITENYLLGIGDELIVTLQGNEKKTFKTKIDREGRILLPGHDPIRAANRPFNEFRDELANQIENSTIGTKVYISVGAIRMISVVIAGEVNQPGRYQLTALSNISDALFAAQGIRKTGSLRHIKIRRGKRTLSFDAYSTLLGVGATQSPPLQHGDQIIVPTIGDTIAVAGNVKRPGIFELKYKKQRGNNLDRILNWAGGPLRNQGNRYLRQTLDKSGQEIYVGLNNPKTTILHADDILQVQPDNRSQLGSIALSGNVQVPGKRSSDTYPTLRTLLGNAQQARKVLGERTYLPFAAIWTTNPDTQARYFHAINLKSVLDGKQDYHFRNDDKLIVLSHTDIQFPMSADVQNILTGKQTHQEQLTDATEAGTGQQKLQQGSSAKHKNCRSLQALKDTLAGQSGQRFANAIRIVDNRRWLNQRGCPTVYEQHPSLLSFILEYMVILDGEIRQPGIYPVAKGTLLDDLISFAGNLTQSVDPDNIELNREILNSERTKYQLQRQQLSLDTALATIIHPGDSLRFNPYISNRGQGGILLVGEFNHPGIYTLARGETLSQIIARAGGLTAQAYPYGAVLTRERLKQQEQRNYTRTARDLQDASFALLHQRNSGDNAAAVSAIEGLVKELKQTQAVGRIVIEADPAMLSVHPELDTLLESGDTLYMPQRSNIVSVTGEVLNPGTSLFIPGNNAGKYIAKAGGLRRYADDKRIFVVLPNGEAQPLRMAYWNYSPVKIPPGSTIVVPRDTIPFNLYNFTYDITSIFSNLAVSAAAIRTINNN
jgi:protein involved in polysaccharide export with SLBB domain